MPLAVLTRLSLCGLLVLSPWTVHAQTAQRFVLDRASPASDEGPEADASAAMPPMHFPAPAPRNVRKLSDSDLTCAQIHAETQALEQASQGPQAEAALAQAAMTATQNEMTQSVNSMRGAGVVGGIGSAVGSSLLGMIPGAGQIQGYAMQAAAEARRASMQDSVQKMMQAQTQLMNAEQALEHARARSDHLADLFLRKGCKLSEMKAAAGAPAAANRASAMP